MNDAQPELPQEPSRKVRLLLWLLNPKVGIPLIILLSLIAAPFMYRMSRINMLPDIGDPFDVEAFGTVDIPDEENAFVEYRAASKLLVEFSRSSASSDEYSKALDEGWSAASEDIRKWVEANHPAMELWRKGTEKPDALYHQPKDVHIGTLLPVTQNLREFARLIQIEGSRLEEEGELEEAWEWYRAMYRSGRHSGRYGCMIERLVGIAILAISTNSIEKWSRHPQVTADQLEQAIQQLQSDYQMTDPTSHALKVEYLSLRNTMSPAGTADLIEGALDVPLPVERPFLYFIGEPELSYRVIQHVWKNQLAHIEKPLHQRPRRSSYVGGMLFESSKAFSNNLQQVSPEQTDEALQRSIFARMLIPAMQQIDEAVRREQLRHRALLVVLAAQWYQREHGEFPEKIENLLDGYLDEIPLDPHNAKGGKLQYRRNPEGFTVWGLGANGRDDGGQIGWDRDHDDFGFHVGKKEEKTEEN